MNPLQRNTAVHRPRAGDRVLDRRTGRTGIYMDTVGGEHYLRPESGGREWTADPSHVTPAPADDDPDSHPDPARSGDRGPTGRGDIRQKHSTTQQFGMERVLTEPGIPETPTAPTGTLRISSVTLRAPARESACRVTGSGNWAQ